MKVQDMEGYEGYQELVGRLLNSLPPERVLSRYTPEQLLAGLSPEQVLAGLSPEQALAGVPPEQRLAGLDRDQQALAIPIEVLRLLPEEYLHSLAPAVELEIRRRLRQTGR